MSGNNAPSVQVFHFTSRISSAKIRKYKLATERGMAGGSVTDSTPTARAHHASPSPSMATPSLDSGSTMEPPAKKPKLKLNVRRPSHENAVRSHSPDTIAVSRPWRDSSLKPRQSEDMVIDQPSTYALASQRKASPAASSDLSSLSSVPPPEKEQVPAKEPAAGPSKSRDYSRDFMSYYVTGGDDDGTEEDDVQPPPKPAPLPKQQPPKPVITVPQPPPAIPQETRFKHHTVPPPYPPAKAQPPPRPAPPPVPQVNLIDTIKPSRGPREPDTVAVMIKKLEHLSRTLTEFGGVPPIPQSPGAVSKPTLDVPTKAQPVADAPKEDAAVDNFLAMFDDDDSEEKDGSDPIDSDDDSALNYKLPTSSETDDPLKYGIVFIQNALRSWAYQRVTSQVGQQYQQHLAMQARAEPQKRGPGRPRKFDDPNDQTSFPQQPPVIQFDLAKTPEGAAIIAFQDVLDCGCLQLNCSLPVELSRALRHLYMQIDHLINQGSRSEPQWRCMSYGAQITAHRIRVEKWKEQQARAQQEMARQQQLANIQVMQQMGLPPNVARVPLTAEQAQQAHAIELERRRSLQLAAQQPHLSKYITTPMSLDSGPSLTPNTALQTARALAEAAKRRASNDVSAIEKSATPVSASGTGPLPVNGARIPQSPKTATANSTPNVASLKSSVTGQTDPKPSTSTAGTPMSAIDLANVQLDKIKLYMPNYLPRSGQSMKFSFAPSSELALKAFGAQAFPNAGNAGSSIPNRGPMSISTANSPTSRQPNGTTPVLGSNAPPASPSLNRDNSDTIEVAIKPPADRDSQAQAKDGKVPLGKNGKPLPSQSSMMGSFNAMNAPVGGSRSNSISDSTMKAASAMKMGENAKASDMVSRFPHPGAVVVDQ